jgi:hypothetical protein
MGMTLAYDEAGDVLRVIATFTSDASGNASATTRAVGGRLVKGTLDPGSPTPTSGWDVTITDESGVNVLSKCDTPFENGDTNTSLEFYPLLKSAALVVQPVAPLVGGPLTIAVSNAGDSKAGRVILHIENGRKF